jgi:N-methylhydantoinase A
MTSRLRMTSPPFRVAVDIGGTFTDCVIVDARGVRTVAKSLTTHESLPDGVLAALAVGAAQVGLDRPEVLAQTELFVHGTTVATNAVLTRTGARTGLITSRGHEDAIIIGKVYAKRAGLPERDVVHSSRLRKPEPIVPRALIRGVPERIDVDGDVIVALRDEPAVAAIDSLVAEGVEAIAVSLLWSFLNAAHERRIAELLAERAPGVFVTLSSDLVPVLGEYERTATTAINAYIGPKVVGYLEQLEQRLREEGLAPALLVMQASGGLTSVGEAARRPIFTLDSGPTGGVLGCHYLGRLYGEENVVCTDVGGTSFDVGVIVGGQLPSDPEPVVSQYVLRIPKVSVQSIGAGGGSIAWIDEGGLLRVGPQSAGSRPGPACYGLGGEEATVTDADLVLAYLDPGAFLGGRMELRRDLALGALARLGTRLAMEPEEVAVGVFRIINSHMADLIRKSTIEQGHDPRECVLVAYGGAGPTHSVFYGHDIGSKAILVPADSTAFSAEGMLTCDVTHTEQASHLVTTPLGDEDLARMTDDYAALERRVLAQFEREGAGSDEVALTRQLSVRYRLQVHSLDVEVDLETLDQAAGARIVERFEARYGQLYGPGALLAGGGLEFERHAVVGRRVIEPIAFHSQPLGERDASAGRRGERSAHFEPGGFRQTPVYDGRLLIPGNVVEGPAIIERMGDSVVVPPGYEAAVDAYQTLRLCSNAQIASEAAITAAESRA